MTEQPTCPICRQQFSPYKPTSTTCSARCRNVHTSRKTAQTRGDTLRGRPRQPRQRLPVSYIKRNGRHEHRVVMEQILGRPLAPGEVVHHKDHNPSNNDPDNLMLLVNQGEHARIHSTKPRRSCSADGCERHAETRGLCGKHYQRIRIAEKKEVSPPVS